MADLTKHIADLCEEWKTKVRNHFPLSVVQDVDVFDGDFGTDEIDRYSVKANAIIITLDGGDSTSRGNSIYEQARFDFFILCKSTTSLKRAVAVKILYEHLLRLIHFPGEFVVSTKTPEHVTSKNLFGEKLDEQGLALYAVRFDQLIEIPGIVDSSTLANFETFYLTNTNAQDLTAPDNGPVDEQQIELEQ